MFEISKDFEENPLKHVGPTINVFIKISSYDEPRAQKLYDEIRVFVEGKLNES